jgi:hypothetical protein
MLHLEPGLMKRELPLRPHPKTGTFWSLDLDQIIICILRSNEGEPTVDVG